MELTWANSSVRMEGEDPGMDSLGKEAGSQRPWRGSYKDKTRGECAGKHCFCLIPCKDISVVDI